MNTVHRLPRLTGARAFNPYFANSSTVQPIDSANVLRKDPQPDEHASLSIMLSIAPLRMLKHFMSCPPMSSIKSTSGWKYRAAV